MYVYENFHLIEWFSHERMSRLNIKNSVNIKFVEELKQADTGRTWSCQMVLNKIIFITLNKEWKVRLSDFLNNALFIGSKCRLMEEKAEKYTLGILLGYILYTYYICVETVYLLNFWCPLRQFNTVNRDTVIMLTKTFVDPYFLPAQSLYKEVNSGTPSLEDPHWSPQGQKWG